MLIEQRKYKLSKTSTRHRKNSKQSGIVAIDICFATIVALLQKTRDMVVVESSALVLKSECADILHQSFLRMLRQVEELPNNNSETTVYGHTPALL